MTVPSLLVLVSPQAFSQLWEIKKTVLVSQRDDVKQKITGRSQEAQQKENSFKTARGCAKRQNEQRQVVGQVDELARHCRTGRSCSCYMFNFLLPSSRTSSFISTFLVSTVSSTRSLVARQKDTFRVNTERLLHIQPTSYSFKTRVPAQPNQIKWSRLWIIDRMLVRL